MRTAALAALAAAVLALAGCKDKPNDEDCVKSCAHFQELALAALPEEKAKWEGYTPVEQDKERALCKQSCQNSGSGAYVKCVLAATTHEAALACLEE